MIYFASNLKAILKEKGLSQQTLADNLNKLNQDLNIANTTISSWVVGKSKPTIDTLLLLKEILGYSLDDLFYKDFTNKSELKIPINLDYLNEPPPQYEKSDNEEKPVLIEKSELEEKRWELALMEIDALRRRVELLEMGLKGKK